MKDFTLGFNPAALFDVLPMLGKGLLGIFVVICAIWGFVVLLNKISAPKQEENK